MGKWPMVRIGDVCEFIRNGANIIQDNSKKGFPITRIETISNGVFDRNRMGYAGIYDLGKYGDYVLKTGDILMSHINSVSHLGKTAYYENIGDETIIHGMNLLCLRLKKEQVDYKYTFYYLNSPFFKRQIPKITKKSVNQASFTVTALKQLKFILPPLNMQKRIADILDKTQEIIDGYKKQLTELDILIKAVFYEMFGDPVINDKKWKHKKMGDVCDVRDGTHDSPKYVKKGYPLVTSKNVIDGSISFENINYISKEDYDQINKRSKVDLGDIIMPMIGTIGRPAIVKIKKEFAIKNVALIKFTHSEVNNIYIHQLLSSSYLKMEIEKKNRGGTQKFISLGDIRNLTVPIPPLDLQTKFADIVTKIEEQKVLVKRAITDSEQLFNSLMSKYFD